MPDTPKSIVYLRPDTIGDLVIFSSALEQLKGAWPDARHTIVVRPAYVALAPLFPSWLEWQISDFNPFSQKPSECRLQLPSLLAKLEELQPDLVVAGTINRTWLEIAVAAHFPNARRVALGNRTVDPLFATALRLELKITELTAFNEIVPADENLRDWENNHRLVDQLVGRALPRPAPKISVPASASATAAAILADKNLSAGNWAAFFPAGIANVPIKAWPAAKFAEAIVAFQQGEKLPVLLLGHATEEPILRQVANFVENLGGIEPQIWLGRDGEVPLLAAMLQSARCYIGNDTGAMHLAAAVGRPVVGIFGGGHWPRFRPIGRQTISVVQPLPCFGCNWDCYFGDAPCVKTISVADVNGAIAQLLAAGDRALDDIFITTNLSDETLRLISAATPRYRSLQHDRIDRQHKIEELKQETDHKDVEISALKQETDRKDVEIGSLKGEADTKDTEITDLKRETDLKDSEILALKREADAIKTELEAECAEKDREITQLKIESNTKDGEIAALKKTCDEREQLIFTLSGHITNFQKTVAELSSAHSDKDRHIANLDAEIARLQAVSKDRDAELAPQLQRLAEAENVLRHLPEPGNAERIAQDFAAKDVHIQNIEALVKHRDEELALLRVALNEREQSLINHATGHSGLEVAKYYGKLLAEKEAVIQMLNTACIEREAIIRQLAGDAAGIGRVHKLWTAAREHWRIKFSQPIRQWLFKKTVEDYWMQIGVLRHYDPRKLVWDKFPKPHLPDEKLPQLAMVTPSYGQAAFVESTMLSILNQNYPKLHYVVQDGGSKDASAEIISKHADRLAHWESVKDKGQADAVKKGFAHLEGRLGPNDIMAWLNSDDLIAPRALRFVAEYFAMHPEVDCVYGHRIIIDPEDRDVGRWVMPAHEPKSLEWIDYVPQETLFWRKRAWDTVGGIDPSFQFALDWDLLARFTQANLNVVRLPYFLGCFRVHQAQKTSAAIHTTGAEEMTRVRTRFHGPEKQSDMERITSWARRIRFRGAVSARLLALGIRR